MLFSIIVPAYNVELYLRECISSIQDQLYKEYQVILVDDGSTDSTGSICDELAEKDSRIVVIHKENGGLSEARNVGLMQASGDYIIFLDSDDYWNDNQFLSETKNIIQKQHPDLIVFGYKKVKNGKVDSVFRVSSSSKTIDQLTKHGEFNICAWDKVIKRSILNDNNINFRKGVFSEDMEWCSKLFKSAFNVEVLRTTPYSYRQREGSITRRISEKNIYDMERNLTHCLEISNELSEERNKIFQYYLSRNLSMLMIEMSVLDKNIQKKYYPFIKKNAWRLKYSSRNREKIIYTANKVLGLKMTETILSIVYGAK